ncbi:MAG: hypothetical protein K1X67_19515 [Fimbriimonadaceae bacterium]|nr:hypothetical protein [Fimbriimonadaceae bacterium]
MVRSWFALAGRITPGMLVRSVRLSVQLLVPRAALMLALVAASTASWATIAVTASQPGLQEWRQAGPGTGTQGSGTRFYHSSSSSGTVTENAHVLRVEVKLAFTGLPSGCEVYAGAGTYGLDAAIHTTVYGLTLGGITYNAAQLSNSNSTISPFVFHIINPSSGGYDSTPRTVTVRYFVKDGSTWSSATMDCTINRFNCFDAGVDSRKAYGDPNVAGRIEASSNAIAQSVVFSGWTYRGGLFAGNMPWESSSDRSGLARTQFWFDPGSTTVTASVLTLFRKGYNNEDDPNDRGSPNLGVFLPLSTDANLVTSGSSLESTSKWSTRLTVAPAGNPSGSSHRWDQNPISIPSVYLDDEYVNFALQKYAENGTVISSTQTHNAKHMVVALSDETGLTSTGTLQWRYFASREYETASTGIYSDSRPRVWTLTQDNPTAFGTVSVSQ